GGHRSGALAGRHAAPRQLRDASQRTTRGALRDSRPQAALHAAQEDRSFALSSEPGLSRTRLRARAARRVGSLVARRHELHRGPAHGAFDRRAEAARTGLSKLVRPLSLRPYRTRAAEEAKASRARSRRDRRLAILRR